MQNNFDRITSKIVIFVFFFLLNTNSDISLGKMGIILIFPNSDISCITGPTCTSFTGICVLRLSLPGGDWRGFFPDASILCRKASTWRVKNNACVSLVDKTACCIVFSLVGGGLRSWAMVDKHMPTQSAWNSGFGCCAKCGNREIVGTHAFLNLTSESIVRIGNAFPKVEKLSNARVWK